MQLDFIDAQLNLSSVEKMPVSGEITVIALAITVRPNLKTISNWLQIVSTTFHLAIFRSCGMA